MVVQKCDNWEDTVSIAYFENGTARFKILPQNIKTLFHTIVRWNYTCENRDSEASSVSALPNCSDMAHVLAVYSGNVRFVLGSIGMLIALRIPL